MRIRTAAAAVIASLALVIGCAGTGQADTTPTYTDDLLTTRLVAPVGGGGGLEPLLQLPARHFDAGERLWLTARLAGNSDAERMPRMAIRIDGVGPGDVQRSTIASTNHDGQAAGTQYVSVRWLFVAPVAGTWTITARAEATSLLTQPDGSQPSIYPQPGLTYLKSSVVHPQSQEWKSSKSHCVGTEPVTNPDIPDCADPVVTKTVMGSTIHDVPTGIDSATAPVELELSREYGSFPGGTSTMEVSIEVTPWALGAKCGQVTKAVYPVSISSQLHHKRLNATVAGADLTTTLTAFKRKRAGLVVGAACPQVKVITRLTHTGGNPVGLEGPAETASYILWN
jgi:hypothetical protein